MLALLDLPFWDGFATTSGQIDIFRAFVKWIENKDSLPVNIKQKMLKSFDLDCFSNSDLVNIVKPSNLFDEKDMCNILGENLVDLEKEEDKLE